MITGIRSRSRFSWDAEEEGRRPAGSAVRALFHNIIERFKGKIGDRAALFQRLCQEDIEFGIDILQASKLS